MRSHSEATVTNHAKGINTYWWSDRIWPVCFGELHAATSLCPLRVNGLPPAPYATWRAPISTTRIYVGTDGLPNHYEEVQFYPWLGASDHG